jgi:hypothetical protein
MTTKRALSSLIVTVCVSLVVSSNALAANLTVGYQTGIDPSKVPQAGGLYEKTTGQKLISVVLIAARKWAKFAEVTLDSFATRRCCRIIRRMSVRSLCRIDDRCHALRGNDQTQSVERSGQRVFSKIFELR